MNDKVKALLLKFAISFKERKWIPSPDYELTIKTDGKIPFQKQLMLKSHIDDYEIKAQVLIDIDFSLITKDEITYFPQCIIYTSIDPNSIAYNNRLLGEDFPKKDITYKLSANAAFTDKDFTNDRKIKSSAEDIYSQLKEFMGNQFDAYCSENEEKITQLNLGQSLSGEEDDDRI